MKKIFRSVEKISCFRYNTSLPLKIIKKGQAGVPAYSDARMLMQKVSLYVLMSQFTEFGEEGRRI